MSDREIRDEPLTDEELRRLYGLSDQEPERGYRPIHPEPAWRSLLRKLWAPIAALGFVIWKFKFVALAVFKLKFFSTIATMLVSIGAYALAWGWKFAVGFVLLILVHELGHVFEAKRQGLPVSAPMFIPFLGAFIALKDRPLSVWNEAKLAAAGPILGSLGALAVWGVYGATGEEYFLALAFVGFFLNLFNLAPIWQLDGGRMISAVHPGLWIPGLAALAVVLFFFPSPILLIIVVLGAFQAWHWWQNRHHPEEQRYYRITPGQRLAAGALYLGLLLALGLATSATHLERDI